ncbi:MAG TPA: PAS domain-containing sensor histidine kinase [Ignavibacteriales bacterium]|nr:PAS domain-containing sensor histidine kinase [Ignavibacteriales bacterium]
MMNYSKKLKSLSLPERRILYLKSALTLVAALTLGSALFMAAFMPAAQEMQPVDINMFNTGQWNQTIPFEPYYDGPVPLRAEILKDSSGAKFFRVKAQNDSAAYSGVSFHIDRPVPENAELSITWRGRGFASLLIIDVMDGSVVLTEGQGDTATVTGENFFTESSDPGEKWTSFNVPLRSLLLNPAQPSGRTINGVFDFSSVRQVSISICPNSNYTLDVKDLRFSWSISKWAMVSVLFFTGLVGLLLILRTKPQRIFPEGGKAFNVNAIIPRIVFCLTGLSAFLSALMNVSSFDDTVNLAIYGTIIALIVTDEFLVFLKPDPVWSLRYVIVLFTGYFMGCSCGILAYCLLLLASCMPLITERIKAIFWAVIILAILVYIRKPLQDADFPFLTGLIMVAGTCAILILIREYLLQQHKDFILGQAIRQYEALFKETSDAIYVLNAKGEIVTANQSFERLTGCRLQELTGQHITSFVDPESENTVREMLKATAESETAQYDIHFANRNGGIRTALVRCTAIYRDKHIAGYQTLATDITERKLAEEKLADTVKLLETKAGELQVLNAQLRDLNISKDKFFSIISHDLKNPFTSIMGFSDLLIKDYNSLDKDEIKMFAENINGGIKKVYNLLNNLLQWASIQSGKMTYEARILRLHKMAGDAADMLQDNASAKGITILNKVEKDILVYADQNSISSVIQNLVTNAIKFTNPGGTVEITSLKSGRMVYFSVSDTGIGMTKEQIEKLFRIDVQQTTAGTAKETGTGLGLILCKEMVERNGGKLTVESQPGLGSRFTFTLTVFESQEVQRPTSDVRRPTLKFVGASGARPESP